MRNITDHIGEKYNNLLIIGKDNEFSEKTYNANHWLFKCDCGNVISDRPSRILSGHRKSCGCRKIDGVKTHGLNNDPFYHTWWSMMRRCYNQEAHNFHRYGGRGIQVCEEWKQPQGFIEWAHNTCISKSSHRTLDRIDNNGNYCPENCRWVIAKKQANNRRNTTFLTIEGKTKSLSEWCEYYGMPVSVVGSRIRVMGWDAVKALTTPIKRFNDRGKKILINGEEKTIKEWSIIFGINTSTVYGRIRKGISPEDAITTPIQK